MLRKIKISTRLGIGFSCLVLILGISSFSSIYQINSLSDQAHKVVDLRVPTAQASGSVFNGVNHALAALRGWMLLGKDKFKDERQAAWDIEINPSIALLEKMSKDWKNPKNIERLREMKDLLTKFDFEQKKIEEIAQTVQNTPAIQMLYEEAVPQASIMAKEITNIINAELRLGATTDRKALLGMMADVRGSLGLSLANIRGFLLSGEEKYKVAFLKLWTKNQTRFEDLSAQQPLFSVEQQKSFEQLSQARDVFMPLPRRMLALREGKDWNLGNHWLATKAAPLGFRIKVILSEMSQNQKALLASDAKIMVGITDDSKFVAWIMLIVGTIVGIALAWFITPTIVGPVNRLVDTLTKVDRDNDLTATLPEEGNDELARAAQSFNKMMYTFGQSIGQVENASNKIADHAKGTTSTSIKMEESINHQAEQTELISVAINQMLSTVKSVAKNTLSTSDASSEAKGSAGVGSKAMEETITTIGKLAGSIRDTSERVKTVEESSNNIAKVLQIITDIAEQTNLLALNAAIEAARAGEQGRGFAVVADEVRTLAGRTKDSTSEINTITKELISSSQAAVASMNSTQQQVDEVVSKAELSSGELSFISEAIIKISEMSMEIAAASEKQERTTDQININVSSINDTSRENVQIISDISQSSQELRDLSSSLQKMVAQFKHVA